MNLHETEKAHGVRIHPKETNFILNLWAKIFPPFRRAWVTIGETIYYPASIDPARVPWTIEHELVHVYQYRAEGAWFWFKYIVSPGWRWRYEREAYLVNARAHIARGIPAHIVIEAITSTVSGGLYLWMVKAETARRWFYEALKDD